jgi:hypothetical protein
MFDTLHPAYVSEADLGTLDRWVVWRIRRRSSDRRLRGSHLLLGVLPVEAVSERRLACGWSSLRSSGR